MDAVAVDTAAVTAYLREHHRCVLVTRKGDGGLQTSPVVCGVDDEGRVLISVTADRAKTANLRRDPRATLTVLPDEFFGPWLHLDGDCEVVDLPEALDLLVDLYRQVSGEHDDWSEFRAAMQRDRRCILRITPTHAAGPGAGG